MERVSTELKLKDHFAKVKEEQDKKVAQWNFNLKRASSDKKPNPAAMIAYPGVYEGGLDFYIKNGHLYCRNAERANSVYELKYIEKNLFVLDENVQVEFAKDEEGKFSKIKMHWKDGAVSEKKRT